MSYIYVCVNWAIQMLLNFCTLNSIVNSIIWKIPTMGLNLFPPLHMQTPLDKKEKEHKFYALRWWWLQGLWAGFMNQKEIIFHHATKIEWKKREREEELYVLMCSHEANNYDLQNKKKLVQCRRPIYALKAKVIEKAHITCPLQFWLAFGSTLFFSKHAIIPDKCADHELSHHYVAFMIQHFFYGSFVSFMKWKSCLRRI